MCNGEEPGDAIAVAICSQWKEDGVTFADGLVGCQGALVCVKEGVPISGGDHWWVLQVPPMCCSCSNVVAEKETNVSIGTVKLIMNNDCGEPMRNLGSFMSNGSFFWSSKLCQLLCCAGAASLHRGFIVNVLLCVAFGRWTV